MSVWKWGKAKMLWNSIFADLYCLKVNFAEITLSTQTTAECDVTKNTITGLCETFVASGYIHGDSFDRLKSVLATFWAKLPSAFLSCTVLLEEGVVYWTHEAAEVCSSPGISDKYHNCLTSAPIMGAALTISTMLPAGPGPLSQGWKSSLLMISPNRYSPICDSNTTRPPAQNIKLFVIKRKIIKVDPLRRQLSATV